MDNFNNINNENQVSNANQLNGVNQLNNTNQTNGNNMASMLPMMSLKEIPNAKPGARQIVGLVKDSGHVTGYQLSDGNVVTKQEGVQLAKQGEIQNVGVSTRKGNEYLKSIPDGSEGNNLSNLPSVSADQLQG